MGIISPEARLIGDALRHGRKMNGISRVDAARVLKISLGDLGKIEGGRMLMRRGLLFSLMYHGLRARAGLG